MSAATTAALNLGSRAEPAPDGQPSSHTRHAGICGAKLNSAMTAEVALSAARRIVAHLEGRHDDVAADLAPIRRIAQRFGGSHAQRDLIQRTVTDSAIRSGRLDLARALVDERLSERETSVYGLVQRARVLSAIGDARGACAAEEAASTNQARFAATP